MLARRLCSFRRVALCGGLAVACSLVAAGTAWAGWESPQAIDNGSGYGATESSQTALAVGPNGVATALFFQTPSAPSGAPSTPFMVRRPAGESTAWSAPAAVATPGGQPLGGPNPVLAASAAGSLGAGGTLGLFGLQPSSGNVGVVSTAWPASGSPGAATATLCTSGGTPECAGDSASAAQVGVDGAGNGYAVGEATSGGVGDILFARTDPTTGSWQPAQVIATNAELPLIAVDPGGDVVVTYAVQDTSTPGLYDYHEDAVREPAGQTTFSAPAKISGPNSIFALSGRLALVIDQSGTATAAFLEDALPPTFSAPTAPEVEAVQWPLGATPSSEHQLSASVSGGQPTDVNLAVSPAGRVTAVWDALAPSSTVFAAQLVSGSWGAAQQLSAQNTPDTYSDARVAMDAQGTATAVYLDAANGGTGTTNVDAQLLSAGGAWSAPVTLGSTASGAGSVLSGSLAIAASSPGQADVIFVQALNGTNRLLATRFTDTTAPAIEITTPADGASYKHGATVVADYSCTDPDSPVSSCAGPVANGQAIDTSTPGFHAFTVTASDPSGNTSSKKVSYMVQAGPPPADKTPPRITISAPRNGAVYTQGQRVIARFLCGDRDSAVSVCRGTTRSGGAVNTRTLGRHSFSVTAQDPSGNTASVTVHYIVVRSRTLPAMRLLVSPRSVRTGTRVRIRFRAMACPSGHCHGLWAVQVLFAGHRRRTDRSGYAAFTVILRKPGRYLGRASEPGYRPARAVVTGRRR